MPKNKNTEEYGTLDALREAIEKKQRFSNAVGGYNKSEVNEYIVTLKKTYSVYTDELEIKCKKQEEEKAALSAKIDEYAAQLAELRNEQKTRAQAEESLQESLAASLREANQKLMDENRQRLIEVSELNDKIEYMKRQIEQESTSVKILCDSLRESLKVKISECDALVDAWKNQCSDVISHAAVQVNKE